MISFKFNNGFYEILRDGVAIASTGGRHRQDACEAVKGPMGDLERVCRYLGGDVLAAYETAYPKQVATAATRAAAERKYRRALKGW